MHRYNLLIVFCLFTTVVVAGCAKEEATNQSEQPVVVVYTALDRGFSEPILNDFTKQTGIKVLAKYDTESTKSVGLANMIRTERNNPRCDVFWNNEIVNTLQLKKEGLLEQSKPEEAKNYPDNWKDSDGYWYGFAARARVIIVNTELVKDASFPNSILDLASPEWKGKTGIAKPLFGTTASHVACLFSSWGEKKTMDYLDSLKENNIQIHGGNKGCAQSVATGTTAFALTDTDDAIIELESGKPVRIVYPDGTNDGTGTLFLPNTLAVIANAPHRKEAEALINYLLSAEVEQRLSAGPSAQIPLNSKSAKNSRVKDPRDIKAMKVDFEAASEAFDKARQLVEERFLN